MRVRAALFLWLRWSRAVERWSRVGERLHLRIHVTHVHFADVAVAADAAMVVSGALAARVVVSGNTVEERLDQLESHMREVDQQISILRTWHEQEVRDRQSATEEERTARVAEDQRIRESIANLSGGLLKLHACGVVCPLAGPGMTPICAFAPL